MAFQKIHFLFILYMLNVSACMSLGAQPCTGASGGQIPWNWRGSWL